MSRGFNTIREFLRGHATTQPNAPNGDSTLTESPPASALGGEPLPAEAIAATAAKTMPVQIVLIVLGTIAFL